jgi:hypothetical protein
MTDAIHALVAARTLAAWRTRRRPQTPAELAVRLDPKFIVTPTIRLLSDIAVVHGHEKVPSGGQ